MKHTRIFSLAALVALLCIPGLSRAQNNTVTIGGSSAYSDVVPTACDYKNSVSQFIYTSDELGGACTINSITFLHSDTPDLGGGNLAAERKFQVYITPTTQSDYSSGSWVPVGGNDCVGSRLTVPGVSGSSHPLTFTLHHPFAYDGTGNLAITVVDNNLSFNGIKDNHYFQGDNTGSAPRSLWKRSDGTTYHYTSLPSNPSSTTFRPHVTLGVSAPVDCSGALELPFTCGFESTDNLDCWTFLDSDGDGNGWLDNATTAVAYIYPGYDTVVHSGAGCYMSLSWYAFALTPDNWMITPKLHIPSGGATLQWWDGVTSRYAYAEHYSVVVSTNGTATADFTGNVFETTLTQGRTWTQRSASLAAYAGQDIYIAFRHYDCSHDVLAIDDISVTANNPNGIGDVNAARVKVYPNPATDVVTVRAEALREVSLLDLGGRVLSTTASARVDVSGLAAGVYFLRVVTADGVATEKIVKE